jgi:Na+/H+ antiporter NhaC
VTEIAPPEGVPRRAIDFVLPVAVMVAMMPVGLYVTGDGDLMRGSGSTSVLWAVLAGTALAAVMMRLRGAGSLTRVTEVFFQGFGGLMPLAVLMVLAFALGGVAKQLGTGVYVAGLAQAALHPGVVPAVVFLLACFMAFSTGTSWGTFAIMVPIAAALADTGHAPLLLGAALSGGIFGDHCSPISDTTLIASMAAGTDHIDHVRTQLPYALVAATVATAGYLALGFATA